MALPRNRHEMRRCGYTFIRATRCKTCSASLELWKSTNGHQLAFTTPTDDSYYAEMILHPFKTCAPGAKPPAAQLAPATRATNPVDLVSEAEWLAKRVKARAVIILRDGPGDDAFCVRNGEDGEDLRNNCITQVNKLREFLRVQKEARHG